ncbi:aminodeoxychorismate/anthranilate synthase component II [Thorsellia kenyensis]|uniref:anthranilate synthase n=1 Tax=Thorsellia kenyensis TaxID=1549888 RepID=A0ABV6CAB9_9GAMM
MANILLLDNFDSFTYNLVDQLRYQKHQVTVYRNSTPLEIIIKKLSELESPIIMLSPGPGRPEDAGCLMDLIKYAKQNYPIIGICLGHQAIIQALGGKVTRAPEIVHGSSSLIFHDEQEMFSLLPNPMSVARYHSLVGTNIPDELIVNSYYDYLTGSAPKDKIVMSVRHRELKIVGYQFHPESILTPQGEKLLNRTLEWCLIEN